MCHIIIPLSSRAFGQYWVVDIYGDKLIILYLISSTFCGSLYYNISIIVFYMLWIINVCSYKGKRTKFVDKKRRTNSDNWSSNVSLLNDFLFLRYYDVFQLYFRNRFLYRMLGRGFLVLFLVMFFLLLFGWFHLLYIVAVVGE